ncbi:zinc ABC transporter substrate-binding protein [Helicobacter sp. 11S03491-1]|uniref:metal ABC transporter solute-binding protein, Zn/Mn family n=1 Tax=Helicobacter sp. 11S03491-1 TaxID=1476196 RepID=UPI000BA68781|nr:zinc ABC transporter substrate-binding protein [Helicobacter sp. 11S03491-1]PAF41334.1 hypothetical protein BKH45_07460 [Helicobacter sp. 11S03491-1]
MRFFLVILLLGTFSWATNKVNVIVSVIPQIYFVKKIGGDYVHVSAMVPDGRSPETYEPLPSQIKLIKNAAIYLGVGMEFEKMWHDRFMGVNPTMKFVDLSKALNLFQTHNSSHSNNLHHQKHDPHIWLSIKFARIQAQKIYEVLSQIDVSNNLIYKDNLNKFLKEIDNIDSEIKIIFAQPHAQKIFVVYHPAFGYLANEYGLEEIALENEGKSPKTKQLIAMRKLIQQKNIKVIYIQPQFSKKRIQSLANDLKLKVLELDPLAPDWEKNMVYIAKMIATQGKISQ